MKKTLYCIAFIAIGLFGCKKNNENLSPKEGEKKYDVKFSVADFSQVTTGMGKVNPSISAVGDTLGNYAEYLYYRIYNSAGVMVNSANQTKSMSNFGTITDRLTSGTYSVLFAAGKSANLSVSGSSMNYNNCYISDSQAWDDTFTKALSLTVSTSDITQSVRLERLVGGLELVVLDSIPANIAKISIVFQSETQTMLLKDESLSQWGVAKTKNFTLTSADIGKRNRRFMMHIANVSSPSTVFIRAYDSSNGLIVDKTVNNVSCYKNKKTILSGNLFTGGTNPAVILNVFVNPTWGTPVVVNF